MKSLPVWHFALSISDVGPYAAREVVANLLRATLSWANARGLGIQGTARVPRDGESTGDVVCDYCLIAGIETRSIPESQAIEMLRWLHQWGEPRALKIRGEYGDLAPDIAGPAMEDFPRS
jgi:hypothetical protein